MIPVLLYLLLKDKCCSTFQKYRQWNNCLKILLEQGSEKLVLYKPMKMFIKKKI